MAGLVAVMAAGPTAATDELQAWLGAWQGTARQGHEPYGVEMLLRPADAEGRVGFSHYAQLGCSGTLSRDATLPGEEITFRETYFQGPHCLGYRGGRISLARAGDGARWRWHDAGGRLVSTGTLTRAAPSAAMAQLAGQAGQAASVAASTGGSASREAPAAPASARRVTSLDGFYVVNVARDQGTMQVALMRYVVRGGDAGTGVAYELHGVASTDANHRLSIGRAASRGRWWPDTQQFDEEHGFPAPTCTYWRYHGWTTPLTPATVELGGRAVGVWQHTGQSPAHRRAATGRSCKVLEFDRACRRAVRCHRWHEPDGDAAWLLVDNRADAVALYDHARARGRLDISPVSVSSGAAGPAAAPRSGAASADVAAATPAGVQRPAARPYDDAPFVARCSAHALLEAVVFPQTADDPQAKMLREHWAQRLQALVPDPAARQAVAAEAVREVSEMARPLTGEGATRASLVLLQSRVAEVGARCLAALPADSPLWRRRPR